MDGGKLLTISAATDLPFLGPQQVTGVTSFEIRDNKVRLVPSHLSLSGAIDLDLPIPLGNLLPPIPIPIGNLPFDVRIASVSTNTAGMVITGEARNITTTADTSHQTERDCPATENATP
ncbi:LmeA family phospholipid-binding protein [Frankia sp. R43]|uniref:LmeA family phospholipid-binding protein n=1 Tax=Frankia sp. R43 TaxID=269536 RepID=UPI000B0D0BFB